MRISKLIVSLVLLGHGVAVSAQAIAPRAVEFAITTPDGKPLNEPPRFHLYDANGRIENNQSTRLIPGRYDLWIEPRGEIAGQIFHGLEVLGGEGTQKFSLPIATATGVRGRLIRPDGAALGNCRVAVQSGTWLSLKKADRVGYARGAQEAYAETITEADGSFLLSGLAPGEYRLDIYKIYDREPHATIPFAIAVAAQTKDLGTWRVPQNGWEWLFDGHLQRGGAPSKYFGQGEIKLENERLILGSGNALTGVTWTKNLPLVDYEISLDAMRAAGQDFFCGLTFPVEKSSLSFIVGGWSGSVVRISNLEWMSAVENETTKTKTFETGRWYRIRLRVTKLKVEAWIDDEKMVDLLTRGHQLSIRSTVEESLPLGIATYHTTAWLRDIRLRRLDDFEIASIEAVAHAEAAKLE